MIKIVIDKASVREKEYTTVMVGPLQRRIGHLKLSLEHLLGHSRDIKNNGIESYKHTTKRIILLIEKKKKHGKKEAFHTPHYMDTIDKYRNGNNKLKQFNLQGLLDYLDDLEKYDSKGLKEMLLWPASDLYDQNKSLTNRFNECEITILTYAISYDYGELANVAKKFFRTHNFVHSCPYCNLENAKYEKGNRGTARGHVLDHFFCQAKFPMLVLCMYNLVPCGTDCNGTDNKGQIPFTKEFHLNPYVAGFNEKMFFSPVKKGRKVIGIEVQHNSGCAPGTVHYKQIFGDSTDATDERFKKGNMNVFELERKYVDKIFKAQKVLNTIDKRVNGLGAIKKFLDMIKGRDAGKDHKNWYLEEMEASFDPEEFRFHDMSKFIRDIHDSYILESRQSKTDFIKAMIKY
ncbi:hypothetical protein [Flavobacterium sp. N502540]|uniref:hypothetical protein n=1 Tax=Flavobacterium sp. N502540 TaxID=2986838 RepID=UPI002224C2A9|nr:hypothetical protein [Flavobacterium sp. N502540]